MPHQCHPPSQKECVHIDISVSPTKTPPEPPIGPTIPPKLLAIMMKYKFNWRIEQLSKPRVQSKKFVPKPEGVLTIPKPKPLRLTEETAFYSDQASRPRLRDLYVNKRLYGMATKGIIKTFNKNIDKAWDSIYNYYKKKERERKLRLDRKKQKSAKKPPPIDLSFYDDLAKPKPVFKPDPVQKPSKIFSDYANLEELAAPKPYHEDPPKSLEVSPEALTYEPTETILQLAKLPARFLNQPQPLEPGKVDPAALRYVASPRIIELAQPKKVSEKIKDEEDFDPWAISKKALTYKATPRILELAKPVEKD